MDGSDRYAAQRERMVARQLAPRGIRDQRVLDAMRTVPREQFVPADLRRYAYEDGALPIGSGQTISQPYIVALMAQEARIAPDDRVLDVGTGSGYGAAVLSRLAGQVYTIERHRELAAQAALHLAELGYANVQVEVGNGWNGWPAHAPYDAIVVAAGSKSVPPALVDQLAPGGRLVIPVDSPAFGQELIRLTRTPDGERREHLGAAAFVPLVNLEPAVSE